MEGEEKMKEKRGKGKENYFKFPEWNGNRNILRDACKAYMESGKKHRGARMRIIGGYYAIRSWNRVFNKWSWVPIVEVVG